MASHQFDLDFSANERSGPLKGRQGHIAGRIEQARVMSGEAYLGKARGQFERERRMLAESEFKPE